MAEYADCEELLEQARARLREIKGVVDAAISLQVVGRPLTEREQGRIELAQELVGLADAGQPDPG